MAQEPSKQIGQLPAGEWPRGRRPRRTRSVGGCTQPDTRLRTQGHPSRAGSQPAHRGGEGKVEPVASMLGEPENLPSPWAGPVERAIRKMGVAFPVLGLRARAIDNAAAELRAQAREARRLKAEGLHKGERHRDQQPFPRTGPPGYDRTGGPVGPSNGPYSGTEPGPAPPGLLCDNRRARTVTHTHSNCEHHQRVGTIALAQTAEYLRLSEGGRHRRIEYR
jgi:hypothetical protein